MSSAASVKRQVGTSTCSDWLHLSLYQRDHVCADFVCQPVADASMCTAQVCSPILSGAQPYTLLFAFPTLILVVACNWHAVCSLAHTVEHAGMLCAQACTICTWNPSDIVCVAGMLGPFASTSLRTHPELLRPPRSPLFLLPPRSPTFLLAPRSPSLLLPPDFHHLYTLSGPHQFYSLPGSHCLNTLPSPHCLTHMPSSTSCLERCLKVRHCIRQ